MSSRAPTRVVLFLVGGGGDPARHAPLIERLRSEGARVLAPTFPRLRAPHVNEEVLRTWERGAREALEELSEVGACELVGVGHSIGAATLLALAGAEPWLLGDPASTTSVAGAPPGAFRVDIAPEPRLTRLALFAPATGFFGPARGIQPSQGDTRALAGERDASPDPGAHAYDPLARVKVPLLVYAGDADRMTGVAHARRLEDAPGFRDPKSALRVVPGADHFSFMHLRPPHLPAVLPERERFLSALEGEVAAFVRGA